MSGRKVAWWGWLRYYFGRFLELNGLLLVTWSMVLYFGSAEMRAMLAMSGVGGFLFLLGWLMARKNPESR